MNGGQYLRLTAAGDVKTGAALSHAVLHRVNVNSATASAVVEIYDGQSTTGTKVARIDASAKGTYEYAIRCENGVYAVMTGAVSDVTITVF